MKKFTQARHVDVLRNHAAQAILEYNEFHENNFGIISVTRVLLTPDQKYLDIFVTAQNETDELPHYLAPIAPNIRERIGRFGALRVLPTVRFRIDFEGRKTDTLLSLISQLDRKYALSSESSDDIYIENAEEIQEKTK